MDRLDKTEVCCVRLTQGTPLGGTTRELVWKLDAIAVLLVALVPLGKDLPPGSFYMSIFRLALVKRPNIDGRRGRHNFPLGSLKLSSLG